MAVDPMTYRQVVGNFATGVAVVTAGRDEDSYAVTVNSFTSVSLSPTLLLVCLDRSSRTRGAILETRVFNINILSDQQEAVSRLFAGRQDDSSWVVELACFPGELGAPLIPGCLAYMECRLIESHEAGDHTILIAEVEHAHIAAEERPLLFFRGKYGELKQSAT